GRRGPPAGRGDLRRDDAPVAALLDGAEDVVAARVDDVRVVAGEDERRVPVEAEAATAAAAAATAGLLAALTCWGATAATAAATAAARPDAGLLAGAQVAPAHVSTLALGVNDVGVVGIDAADEAVAAADRNPVLVDRPAAAQGHARRAPGAVVLEA